MPVMQLNATLVVLRATNWIAIGSITMIGLTAVPFAQGQAPSSPTKPREVIFVDPPTDPYVPVMNYLATAKWKSGWSLDDRTIISDTTDQDGKKATVVAQVVLKGGRGLGVQFGNGARTMFGPTVSRLSPLKMYGVKLYPGTGCTYLVATQTFFLVIDKNGNWNISIITPEELPAVTPI